jgi:hypothetical protein
MAAALPLLVFSAFAERLEVKLATPEVVQERLRSGAVPPAKRQATIRQMFEQAGCIPEEQAVTKKTANVVCTLPGETRLERRTYTISTPLCCIAWGLTTRGSPSSSRADTTG